MRAIQYADPTTVDDAVALLRDAGPRARVLAGGTDLIVQIRENLCDAEVVVDGKRIQDLMELRFDATRGLTIGAAVPCYRLYNDLDVKRHYPGLVDAASIIGGTAIQGRASIGGNLCNSGPAADSIPALIVCGAVAEIAGPAGRRHVAVEEFCTAPGRNVLGTGELLVALHLPAPPPRSGTRYLRFIPRNEMDIAVVGVGASLALAEDGAITEACVALGAVAPTPLHVPAAGDFLRGKLPSDAVFAEAGAIARSSASPISDMRGPADHRLQLVEVLTRRALRGAYDRARIAGS